LVEAVLRKMPEGVAQVGAVKYLDPLNTMPDKIKLFFSKHFRYAYQNEFRVAWLPQKPISKLQPLFISLGSLEDIAEILTVPA
jgi:hypothetical protein